MAGWNHDNAKWAPKRCVVCDTEFMPKSGINKFCGAQCRGKWKYITGQGSTTAQYDSISGNWRRYYLRLLQAGKRKHDGLTIEFLLTLHDSQQGLCALSGLPMTCELVKGDVCFTNASIDRIEAGGACATMVAIHAIPASVLHARHPCAFLQPGYRSAAVRPFPPVPTGRDPDGLRPGHRLGLPEPRDGPGRRSRCGTNSASRHR